MTVRRRSQEAARALTGGRTRRGRRKPYRLGEQWQVYDEYGEHAPTREQYDAMTKGQR